MVCASISYLTVFCIHTFESNSGNLGTCYILMIVHLGYWHPLIDMVPNSPPSDTL